MAQDVFEEVEFFTIATLSRSISFTFSSPDHSRVFCHFHNFPEENLDLLKAFRDKVDALGYVDVSDATLLRFLVSRDFAIPLSLEKLKV